MWLIDLVTGPSSTFTFAFKRTEHNASIFEIFLYSAQFHYWMWTPECDKKIIHRNSAGVASKRQLFKEQLCEPNKMSLFSAYGKVFMVRKIGGKDHGQIYAMKVLRKMRVCIFFHFSFVLHIS